MTTTYLPLQAAVVLAHALVAHVADEMGMRVLFLKGPIATMQGLRAPDYVSGDVDALCEVGQAQRLIDALTARGWYERAESEAHALFVTHSITLCHPEWPCDIDVHTSFPGFLAPRSRVFEALWSHRQAFELAGVDVQAPDYVSQCLVVLLHGLRAPFLPKNQSEVEDSRTRLRQMSPSDQDQLLRLIETTGAAEVVRDLCDELDLTVVTPETPSAEFLAWRLITQPSRTEGWAMAISQAHGLERWRLLFRAVFPTREHLVIDHPVAGTSRGAAARAYVHRWVRAAKLVPGAVCNVAAARQARTQSLDLTNGESFSIEPRPPAELGETPAVTGVPHDADPNAIEGTPDTAVPGSAAPGLAVYSATAHTDTAFLLPLRAGASQVPISINSVGYELLVLLLQSGGDLDSTVRGAANLFDRPGAELRPTIQDFRREMVALGVLQP